MENWDNDVIEEVWNEHLESLIEPPTTAEFIKQVIEEIYTQDQESLT
jgi:hypothetical protein